MPDKYKRSLRLLLSPRGIARRVARYRDEKPPAQHPMPPPYWRPRVRGDCVDGPRPCPYVGCRYHLFTDTLKGGSLRLQGNGTLKDLVAMSQTCALDVADEGSSTLDAIGLLMTVHRERIRQIEKAALRKLRKLCD